jgi:tetratricopeptide (TPR) repeat protein
MQKWKAVVLASSSSALVLACAPQIGRTHLTSATTPTTPEETEVERALRMGDVTRALATAELGESLGPGDPWAHYDRAVSLDQAGQANESAKEFLEAESLFAGRNARGKAISIYGRAHVLASAGRCREARPAYEEYAAFIRDHSPQGAEMALRYAADCIEPVASDPATEATATALVAGEYARALAVVPTVESGWLDYDRAVALGALRRTDEAVASFLSAEREFGDGQRQERAMAIYGRAQVLADALRCPEAKAAYDEYAAFVGATSPHDAEMATMNARDCHGPHRWSVVGSSSSR